MKQGFTLLELSIVLVIIGLIIGGITVGADMIRSAELNAVVSDVNKYKVSVNTFKLKYNALPGDMKNASSYWTSCVVDSNDARNTCNGDGDGIIDNRSAGRKSSESIRAWQHLSLSGIISGNFSGLVFNGQARSHVPDETCPSTPEGKGGCYAIGLLDQFPATLPMLDHNNTRNQFIYYLQPDSSNDYQPREGIISPVEANSIDSKIDDGVANIGSVLSAPNYAEDSNCTINPNTNDNYNLATTDGLCRMYFKY